MGGGGEAFRRLNSLINQHFPEGRYLNNIPLRRVFDIREVSLRGEVFK